MRKLITASLVLLLGGSAAAQIETDRYSTYSPYSIFGIGESRFSWGTAETQAMAGTGVSWSPAGVNNTINPAALTNLRQSTYTLGGSFNLGNYKDGKHSGTHKDIYFDYLVLSVPLSAKSGASFGVTPYSATGYSIYDRDSVLVDGSYKQRLDYYDGNGGITQLYLSYGREVFKNFNLGVTASYLFGTLNRLSYDQVEDRLLQNKTTQSDWVTGFKFKFGFNYSLPLVKETRLYLGGTYDFSTNMNNSRDYRNYVVPAFDGGFDKDNPENTQSQTDEKFKLPWSVTGGIGAGNIKKWYVGVDFQYTNKPDYTGVDFAKSKAEYQSSQRISLGASYTPQYNSPKSYFERVRYQGGLYYRTSEYKLFGNEIKDMGLTLGASLPMTKVTSQTMSLSNFNVFVNFGTLGKAKDGLVKETYFKMGISFSLNDTWFLKQHYY